MSIFMKLIFNVGGCAYCTPLERLPEMGYISTCSIALNSRTRVCIQCVVIDSTGCVYLPIVCRSQSPTKYPTKIMQELVLLIL